VTYIKLLATLFYEYFFTGLFALGGGLATLPFLTRMSGRHPDWFTLDEMANMFAISESTPGPMGVNMATFIGYRTGGVLGSLVATFALVLPSVVLVLIVARMLTKFKQSRGLQSAFYGVRPTVAGLIAAAGWSVIYPALFNAVPWPLSSFFAALNPAAIVLFAVILTLSLLRPLKKIHPAAYIVLAAVAGIVLKM